MFVRLCSIEFDYIRLLNCSITEGSIAPIAFDRQNFLVSSIGFDCTDCVRLAKFFGEFDWVRLGSITERSIELTTSGL